MILLLVASEDASPEESFDNLMLHFENQASYTLLSVVATKLLKELPETARKEPIYECLKKAYSTQSYAICLRPLLFKKIKFKKTILKNKLVQKKSVKKRFASEAVLPRYFLRPEFVLNNESESENRSFSEEIAHCFISLLKSIKQKTGPWVKLPTIDVTSRLTIPDDMKTDSAKNRSEEIQNWIKKLLKSPLMLFKDEKFGSDEKISRRKREYSLSEDLWKGTDERAMRILSPRLTPFFKKTDGTPPILSPDFLSLYEGGSNSFASIPSLLNKMDVNDKNAWMQFFHEVTGMSDLLESMDSATIADAITALDNRERFFMNDTFDFLANTVEDLIRVLTNGQLENLNAAGYTFMNIEQLNYVYKERKNDLSFDLDEYSKMNDDDKDTMLYEEILYMSGWKSGRRRAKRANVHHRFFPLNERANSQNDGNVVKPHADGTNPQGTILTPHIGGTVLTSTVGVPTMFTPVVFSNVIIGPVIVSPYVLSPFLFDPFILHPEVIQPFVLSPDVLSPTILSPGLLSPNIISPSLLSPHILSPLILSPNILSPSIISPGILSPGVLSPSILSDHSVLSPEILSPCVLC